MCGLQGSLLCQVVPKASWTLQDGGEALGWLRTSAARSFLSKLERIRGDDISLVAILCFAHRISVLDKQDLETPAPRPLPRKLCQDLLDAVSLETQIPGAENVAKKCLQPIGVRKGLNSGLFPCHKQVQISALYLMDWVWLELNKRF